MKNAIMSIYDISVTGIDGAEKPLKDYQNQVMLIVNVASRCGFTGQYEGLEQLYKKYSSQGFVVLGFPCNQFAGQEPGNENEIKTFCETQFGVSFPLFSKIEVNGPKTHPLYAYLKAEKRGLLGSEAIKWNFTKFLVDRKGKVIQRYSPQTAPSEIESDITRLLLQKD